MGELKFSEGSEKLIHKKLEKTDRSDEYIFEMAKKIVENANKHNILLRLLGATAFLYHCPKHKDMYKKLKRRLTVEDLLLEKLQIHDITEKDFKDVIILFMEHDFGSEDNREEIDTSYVARVFADE